LRAYGGGGVYRPTQNFTPPKGPQFIFSYNISVKVKLQHYFYVYRNKGERMDKAISLLLIFIGELLAVYSEMYIIKYGIDIKHLLWVVFTITIAGIPLLAGYYLGYKAFSNAWPIAVASISSIVLVEPPLILLMTGSLPTASHIVGFLLATLGLIITVIF
jgi:hypothetical protein